jgi:hypothetical protein
MAAIGSSCGFSTSTLPKKVIRAALLASNAAWITTTQSMLKLCRSTGVLTLPNTWNAKSGSVPPHVVTAVNEVHPDPKASPGFRHSATELATGDD